MNTKKHNQRKRNRGYKNLFWLVRSTRIGSKDLILYNRKPYKYPVSGEYASEYCGGVRWISGHSESYTSGDLINRFPEIDYETLIPVKLIIDSDNSPDMLIQRKKDNLFISNSKVKVIKGTGEEIHELRYPTRISPKLFRDITEELGIVGVRICKS